MNLLIANRGEIALRVMRAARGLGLRCIAVHSDADAAAPHVLAADVAVRIGAAPARESYLHIAAILDAARRTGADAIHPGYGFLSENAAFAQAVTDAGMVFVGPPAPVIARMGDKAAAKQVAREAGVPCLDGHDSDDQADAAFIAAAARIGYPVMVKAAAGGGGRGMRMVADATNLPAALAEARGEAAAAFGDARLLLEPALLGARHVEIQLLADAHGHVLHLGERDCSVQRRHQKLIEEGPALPADLRAAMGDAAVRLARHVGYIGAGTVEFMLGADGRFTFMEMNTRLQVEHAVTELLTGIDLVEWQLRIAMGEALPFTQADIRWQGHAIEARLCAEDPALDFAPQHGPILAWEPPADIRLDHAITAPGLVPPHYDTMLAKLVAHGRTRDEARRKLAAALDATVLLGIPTNRAFLAACLRDATFAAVPPDNGFLTRHMPAPPPAPALRALAALHAAGIGPDTPQPISGGPPRAVRLADGTTDITAGWRVGDTSLQWRDAQHITVNGITQPARITDDGTTIHVQIGADDARFARAPTTRATTTTTSDGTLRAPFAAMIAQLAVAPGDTVETGALLMVLEAMKVQTRITAPHAGTITALPAAGRREVSAGAVLAVITPPGG